MRLKAIALFVVVVEIKFYNLSNNKNEERKTKNKLLRLY